MNEINSTGDPDKSGWATPHVKKAARVEGYLWLIVVAVVLILVVLAVAL